MTPYMLWSMTCSESIISQRSLTQRHPRPERPPGGREREDRAHAQRHRVAAAAARVGVDEVGRGAGELVGHPLLDLRERRQQRL